MPRFSVTPAAIETGVEDITKAVQGIDAQLEARRLVFHLDVALGTQHPRYATPKPNEVHAYARADLVFDRVIDVSWANRSDKLYGDPTREEQVRGELAELDRRDDRHWFMSGEFGDLTITAPDPALIWTDDNTSGSTSD